MDNIAGSPVEGKNFFGRNDIAQRLREILDHDDILLLGPGGSARPPWPGR